MLNQDKHKLYWVLSVLFTNLSYFFIKPNGKIISKKNWWSLKRHTTTLEELAVEIIPNSIAPYSEYEAINYQMLINAAVNHSKTPEYIISVLFERMTVFNKKYSYGGEKAITHFPSLLNWVNPTVEKIKTKSISIWNKLKVIKDKILAKKPFETVIEVVNTTIESIEDKTSAKIDLIKRTVGQICTGNAELDAKYQTVIRYISPQANVYCV